MYKTEMPNWKRKCFFLEYGIKGQLSKLKGIMKADKLSLVKAWNDNRDVFPHQLSITAILKNEANYVQEWIEFHKLVGVTKFYLFDNESEDDLEDKLKPYILEGTVELHKICGHGKQLEAYEEAIAMAKNETRWLAILDLDEFLLPLGNESVLDILNEKKRSAMLIGWMIYGSNGFVKRPKGLVLENYRKHATDELLANYKIIINPRKAIRVVNPHFVQVFGATTDETGKRIWAYPYLTEPQALPAPKKRVRINHYYSKSLEEFQMKSQRGFADNNRKVKINPRGMSDFKNHDQNVEEDDAVNVYLPKLRMAMKLRNNDQSDNS